MGALTFKEGERIVVIDDNAALANNARAAADYDNSVKKDQYCNVYLTNQYDTTAPSANVEAARLYILPGDGASTELYPEGGDATLGTDDTPQAVLYVGSFETINPANNADETLCLPRVELYPTGNRFVLLNVSGQQFDLTWHLDIVPYTL